MFDKLIDILRAAWSGLMPFVVVPQAEHRPCTADLACEPGAVQGRSSGMRKCSHCGCPSLPPGRIDVLGVGTFADTEGVGEVLGRFLELRRWLLFAAPIAVGGWAGFAVCFFSQGGGQ